MTSTDHKKAKTTVLGRCRPCALRHSGIYGVLDDRTSTELKQLSHRSFIPAGDAIFREGDEAGFFFSVVFGVVKLSTTLADGRQHIVEFLYPHSFHGLRLESHYPYSAHAASDVALCRYPRNSFESLVKKHIALEHKLLEMAILELDQSRERILTLARMDSLARVAHFLFTLIRHTPTLGCGAVGENSAHLRLPLSRADIGDYLGLTLETVSRQLGMLQKRGIINLQGRRDVTVPDLTRLAATAGIDPFFPALDRNEEPDFRERNDTDQAHD